jgi:radical SAM superfamily enzyme YgiQ (UPF0313 family)
MPSGGDRYCAIFFPSDYAVGMANLGFHYIYRALREMGVAAERFFASPIPYRSVEHDTMLERFPLILGSVPYEINVLTFSRWLAKGGISPSREERELSGSREFPLIGAGGAVTYINPLSLSEICDFVVLGDGVETVRSLVKTLRRGLSRGKMLAELSEHPSIYVPSVHGQGMHSLNRANADISDDYGHGVWTTSNTVFGNTLLVEIQRGCPRKCRFCPLSYCFTPVRVREVNLVKRDIENAAKVSDFSQIGLITPEAGDYAALDELIEFADRLELGVSFASLRVDEITEKMMRTVIKGGRRSITIAPESGDDSLRKRCGKCFTNEMVLEKLKMAADMGAQSAKLYFMAGLPDETNEELSSIAKLCAEARKKTGLKITAAVMPFVPKPGTPWSEEVFAGEKNLRARYSLILKSFGGISGVKLQGASIKEACLEYAVSWAGPELARLLASEALSGASSRKLERLTDRTRTISEMQRLGLGVSHKWKGGI